MKQHSRRELQVALREAFLKRLDELELGPGDASSLKRTMRALMHIVFDIAECGGCPPGVAVEQIHRVVRKRLQGLKHSKSVWVQKPGAA